MSGKAINANWEEMRAGELRNAPDILKGINKRGMYKWWATKPQLEKELLPKLGVEFKNIKNDLECKGKRYCIYVGIADNESVGSRLTLHIKKGLHNSTLRRSIGGLIVQNKSVDAETVKTEINNFIDNLVVSYSVDYDKCSAKQLLEEESKNINEYLRILNIQKNHYGEDVSDKIYERTKDIKRKLRTKRKELMEGR